MLKWVGWSWNQMSFSKLSQETSGKHICWEDRTRIVLDLAVSSCGGIAL